MMYSLTMTDPTIHFVIKNLVRKEEKFEHIVCLRLLRSVNGNKFMLVFIGTRVTFQRNVH